PDGCVIDGEIVAWKDARVQPFALLQQRIGRKRLTARVLEEAPVVLLAYDLLEWQGHDWREQPQHLRRCQLEELVELVGSAQRAAAGGLLADAQDIDPGVLRLSPLLRGADWPDLARQREASRERGVEGLMFKGREAHYGVGRTKDVGTWWKWKIDP